MKAPEIPADEAQRLSQLRALNIMNTPAEERFDRLTRLARRLYDVPIALVSLLEADHQWFKSAQGYKPQGSPRNISFCGHAILQDEIMIVEDAQKDARFYDNPLVTGEPHIRFYAGCPLRAPGGAKMGTLCIIGREPRQFNEEDQATMRDLAAMAEAELVAFQTATCDELTQITNRRGFMTLGQMVLNECLMKNRPASLTFLDLDKFKQINDTLGHREGDRALMDFADAMKVVFKHSDLFARLGGDEFVVLFNGLQQQQSEALLAQFDRYLKQQSVSLSRRYRLQFSSGVVEFDAAHPQSLEQLLHDSDEQMYLRKKQKRVAV
ncbi:GGDEF domain-containing protein [Pantoea agglomerans]|uniref:sensor domain-containing diguanylate cyclase n=1 Tax=Pantoea vagans TaxID=470934 RepID=UPI000BF1BDFC|nr:MULTISPECIES: sensor domain-containing diguanylate cyclase [Pantoea]MDE8558406.1 sensor domain-containing diguanylate cyclase [Pantoea vagans]MDE8578410.1 sensor domain-containing diguanylate cyclase [Pantoea vagans]PEI04503.1 GGDEF domain-containing protein [Pantoea agglomerans]